MVVYGLTQIFGGTTMNNEIVKTLELMCDKHNPQDKKLLLLAELVETKCEALSENQKDLKQSLEKTNEKLDKLTDLLVKYENDKNDCPVYKNIDDYERLSVFLKYPKISVLVLLGVFALLVGLFTSNFTAILKFLINV